MSNKLGNIVYHNVRSQDGGSFDFFLHDKKIFRCYEAPPKLLSKDETNDQDYYALTQHLISHCRPSDRDRVSDHQFDIIIFPIKLTQANTYARYFRDWVRKFYRIKISEGIQFQKCLIKDENDDYPEPMFGCYAHNNSLIIDVSPWLESRGYYKQDLSKYLKHFDLRDPDTTFKFSIENLTTGFENLEVFIIEIDPLMVDNHQYMTFFKYLRDCKRIGAYNYILFDCGEDISIITVQSLVIKLKNVVPWTVDCGLIVRKYGRIYTFNIVGDTINVNYINYIDNDIDYSDVQTYV